MYVSSTRFQNNFGKYLELCRKDNIIITKNGKKKAVLLGYPRDYEGYESGEPIPDYGTSPRKKNLVTYQEFLKLTEESDQRYELIDGVVYLMASPSFTHQRILGQLFMLYRDFFRDYESCDPFLSPLDIDLLRQPLLREREFTEDDINVVQPDLMVLCDPEKDLDERDKYKGTPSLAIEIISPSSRSKDRVKKLDLYMESGIGEFWIVDPEGRTVMINFFMDYELESEGTFGVEDTARSWLYPGLEVDVGALFSGE
jgi:prevent-host-death family protein